MADQSPGDVKVIEELSPDDDPNVYLKAGWRLIAAYPSSAYSGEPSVQCMRYVVGWVGDGEPVYGKRSDRAGRLDLD